MIGAAFLPGPASNWPRKVRSRPPVGVAERLFVSALREVYTRFARLAAGAAILAIGLCEVAVRLLARWFPIPIAVDWRVAVFAISAAAATAVAFGLLPALSTSRAAMSLRMQDARPLKTRTRRLLVGIGRVDVPERHHLRALAVLEDLEVARCEVPEGLPVAVDDEDRKQHEGYVRSENRFLSLLGHGERNGEQDHRDEEGRDGAS